jgi:hypothetical protein
MADILAGYDLSQLVFVGSGQPRVGFLSAVSTNETDSGFLLAEGFGLIAVT